jgi:hypothetical protein
MDMPFPDRSQIERKTSRTWVIVVVCALLLCGIFSSCSTFGAHQSFTYRKTHDNSNPSKVLTFSYNDVAAPNYFKAVYGSVAGDSQKQVRNRILYELMGMIDDYYYAYTSALRRDVSGKGILVDTTALATSIASTAAGAKELKTVLSAISSSVQGLSKSIDANVLLGNTVQAIRLQMDAGRSSIATEMIGKMKDQSCSDYPLEAGLRDIIRYYDAGTLTSGLAGLVAEAGKKKKDTEKAEQKIAGTSSYAKDTASNALLEYWKPNGTIDPDHDAAIKKWLKKNNITSSVPYFIYSAQFAVERKQALAELTAEETEE